MYVCAVCMCACLCAANVCICRAVCYMCVCGVCICVQKRERDKTIIHALNCVYLYTSVCMHVWGCGCVYM